MVGLILVFHQVLRSKSRSIRPWECLCSLRRHVRQTYTRRTDIRFILAVELEGGGARLRALFGHTQRWLAYQVRWSSARLCFERWIHRLLLTSRNFVLLGEVPLLTIITFLEGPIEVIKDGLIPFVFLILVFKIGFSIHNPRINRWAIFGDSVFSLLDSLGLLASDAAIF